ncbi:ATP-binding domain-containing protein, partial [Corynebacterium pyruviciproducens]
WRMVMRRSPNRWMTLVGDTAQTSAPAGVESWEETLEGFVDKRFTVHRLTVNYRTPAEIMEYAGELLADIDPEQEPARAIRETGTPVRRLSAGTDPDTVAREFDDGRLVRIIDASNVHDIKGLEYDHVILVNPEEIVAQSPQGLQDLYVAATRATQTLTLIGE